MKKTFEKSIVYINNYDKGHVIIESDLGFKKPGDGLSTSMLNCLIVKKLLRSVSYDEKVQLEDLGSE